MLMTKKILIIEDDSYTRDIYEEILKDAQFEVVTAVDGQDGLIKAQAGGYNLILLDVMMPKMNGLELLEQLKQNPPKSSNGPIILLTNLGHEEIVKDALSKGAKSYLVKSDLDPSQLVAHVRKFLS